MYTGSCLCGEIRYEADEIGPAVYCHCLRCRKASGSAFAANALVDADKFRFVQGEPLLNIFSTTAGVHRLFCSQCGSPIISRRDSLPESVRLRLGTLDSPPPAPPQAHIFVASKADWYCIADDLPQHAERP